MLQRAQSSARLGTASCCRDSSHPHPPFSCHWPQLLLLAVLGSSAASSWLTGGAGLLPPLPPAPRGPRATAPSVLLRPVWVL